MFFFSRQLRHSHVEKISDLYGVFVCFFFLSETRRRLSKKPTVSNRTKSTTTKQCTYYKRRPAFCRTQNYLLRVKVHTFLKLLDKNVFENRNVRSSRNPSFGLSRELGRVYPINTWSTHTRHVRVSGRLTCPEDQFGDSERRLLRDVSGEWEKQRWPTSLWLNSL